MLVLTFDSDLSCNVCVAERHKSKRMPSPHRHIRFSSGEDDRKVCRVYQKCLRLNASYSTATTGSENGRYPFPPDSMTLIASANADQCLKQFSRRNLSCTKERSTRVEDLVPTFLHNIPRNPRQFQYSVSSYMRPQRDAGNCSRGTRSWIYG